MILFKIITPEREVFRAEIDEAMIPTKNGQIGILPNHIPLVSLVVPGEILIKKNGEEIFLAVSGGVVEIDGKNVTLLADTAEYIDEIDEARAEEARQRAKERMKEKSLNEEEFAYLSGKIEKELARLRVKKKYKNLRNVIREK